jgi:RNA polymerase sigma-70 factor (ECF subfamily)
VASRLREDDAVRAAYSAYGRELYAYARRALGDPGLAEEAVQETFLRAWRAADRYDAALGSMRTWLFAIVRNIVVDLGRARAKRPALLGADRFDVVASGEDADRVLLSWQVEEALRRLGDHHRAVLVEIHLRGRTYEEVARVLSLPVGTVKSRVFYALKALRLVLEEMGVTDDR